MIRYDLCLNADIAFQAHDFTLTNLSELKKGHPAVILAFTSDSFPAYVSSTLHRYVKCLNSSIASSPGVTKAILVELTFRIFLFPILIYSPRRFDLKRHKTSNYLHTFEVEHLFFSFIRC